MFYLDVYHCHIIMCLCYQMRQSGPKIAQRTASVAKDGQGYATKVVGGVVQRVPIAVS